MADILYGRRYRVFVSNSQGVALDVSQLSCEFTIEKTMMMQPNSSELTIYNLSPSTEATIIREGNRIVIEAGYEGEQYGKIFDGDIISTVREKEDGTTYKLTLYSLDGDRFFNFGFVSFSARRGQTIRQVIQDCSSKATITSELGTIAEGLEKVQLTRGITVFGLAKDYLRQLAKSQNASFYLEDGKVNIIQPQTVESGNIIELSPRSGLIGTPSQTEFGVSARCLLNPRIKLNSLVRIDNSLIRQRKFEIGQIVRSLDNDGQYRVIKITHTGATRGDVWYTDIETISQSGLHPSLIAGSGYYHW